MKLKMYFVVFFSAMLMPLVSEADHNVNCIEERPYGQQIILEEMFPKNWLKVGDKLITDPQLHADLRSKFPKNYTSGVSTEGFKIDNFYGYINGIYIRISNGDFGPEIEYSTKILKCRSCNPITVNIDNFASGSGLSIGQDKAKVSSILGYTIKEDITSIVFKEVEKDKKYDIYHSQRLRVEFRNNKLIRLTIYDIRER